MSKPAATIANAAQRFDRSVLMEDACDFRITTLEDVWKAVRDINNAQRKRQAAQNLRRIEPLLKYIEQFSNLISSFCTDNLFKFYLWAPIKLILQLASSHPDIFEALLHAYTEISTALPQFQFRSESQVQIAFGDIIADVYTIILDFNLDIYRLIRRTGWHVLFLPMWEDFRYQFFTTVEALKIKKDILAKAEIPKADRQNPRDSTDTNLYQSQYHDIRVESGSKVHMGHSFNTYHVLNYSKGSVAPQFDIGIRLQQCATWLAIDDKWQEVKYKRILRKRHDQTCKWIENQPRLKAWLRNDQTCKLLWLTGKPGAGKSVMCSHLLEVLEKSNLHVPCHYFCNSKESESICAQVLRTIVSQLLGREVDISVLVTHEFINQNKPCSLAHLRSLIPRLLLLFPNIRIIVDGIDEYKQRDQRAVLKELKSLSKEKNCKILISSRKEVYIREKLTGKEQISLDGSEELQSDIGLYVRSKIRGLRTSDVRLLERIESILVNKADGMFLWVRLIIEELRQCYNDSDLEATTEALPTGLEKAYGRILDRIMSKKITANAQFLAIRILEWMACSFRVLKSYEVLDGISFRGPLQIGTQLRPAQTFLNSTTQVHADVLNLCKPLIEDGPSDTVEFVHFSAKEYIIQRQGATAFIDVEQAHRNISFSCTAYLNTSLALHPSYSTEEQRAKLIASGFYGLQIYASKFWLQHLQTYLAIRGEDQPIAEELLAQLMLLLKYRKQNVANTTSTQQIYNSFEMASNLLSLSSQDQLSAVKVFVVEVSEFLTRSSQNESDKSTPETIIKSLCESDPTHFSTVLNCYQTTVENLLSGHLFQSITTEDMRRFQGKYGTSAFVCRYPYCSRATDGFDLSEQRMKHEALHQKKYRCTETSCIYSVSGFVSQAQLKKHTEKYHSVIEEGSHFATFLAKHTQSEMTRGYDYKDSYTHRCSSDELESTRRISPEIISGSRDTPPLDITPYFKRPPQIMQQSRNGSVSNVPQQRTASGDGRNRPSSLQPGNRQLPQVTDQSNFKWEQYHGGPPHSGPPQYQQSPTYAPYPYQPPQFPYPNQQPQSQPQPQPQPQYHPQPPPLRGSFPGSSSRDIKAADSTKSAPALQRKSSSPTPPNQSPRPEGLAISDVLNTQDRPPVSIQANIFAQRLQAANTHHLSASETSPMALSRIQSPFRQGSPLAPTGDSFGSAMQVDTPPMRIESAAQMRQKQKAEHVAQVLRQQIQKLSPGQATPKTISPKNALEYHESEEDAHMPPVSPALEFRRELPSPFNSIRRPSQVSETPYSASSAEYSGTIETPNTEQSGPLFPP